MNPAAARIFFALAAVVLSLLFGLVVAVEQAYALSLHPAYFVLAPLTGALLLGPGLLGPHRRAYRALWGVFALSTILLGVVPLSPVKAFRQLYVAAVPGTPSAQVEELLPRFFLEGGRFRRPVCRHSNGTFVCVLDPADGRYNAESIVLHLQAGRIQRREYVSD